ncbi:MAG TPA: DNA-processing protein DprA [Gemmatimonadales bacterium]|jgi:DNA processing protein|nr:DNA-processing protein DprA [Gemmatimonadales bacterium]
MDQERTAYVTLALTPGIGAARLADLLAACGSALGALAAPFAFLRSIPGMTAAAATAVRNAKPADGEGVLAAVRELGAETLLPGDELFPAAVGQIDEPPVLVFAAGNLSLLGRPSAAIVGSRNHTPYGAAACRTIASAFARAGGCVVSGMARGLDAVAHHAALEVGGGTIGVLGNGLGVVYPAANRKLYDAMAERGLLLTEFPPGERPHAGSFPQRNRLISGLARAAVVVEAAPGSGALITANFALEQGKEVLAVPGPITSPTSIGTNRLIRDGATPILDPVDLFHHFPELEAAGCWAAWPDPSTPTPSDRLPADDIALAEAVGFEPVHIDVLAERLRRPPGELLGALFTLELAGVVVQQAGGLFRRV